MDRGRYGAILSLLMSAAGVFVCAGSLHAQGSPSPVPSVAAPQPAASPDARRRAEITKTLAQHRQHDLAASDQEAQKRIEQLPPEEREAFKRNLRVWRDLSPDERDAVRKAADEGMKTEIDKAYQESGLQLDKDRREVFGLRYRQERRRLERELQEKLEAERTRRLPGVLDQLKKEFAEKPAGTTPPVAATVAPSPVSKATPSVSIPAPAASPR